MQDISFDNADYKFNTINQANWLAAFGVNVMRLEYHYQALLTGRPPPFKLGSGYLDQLTVKFLRIQFSDFKGVENVSANQRSGWSYLLIVHRKY